MDNPRLRFLLTAFEPYGDWEENASWLVLQELLRDYAPPFELTTRRYPIDLPELSRRLDKDLRKPYDGVLHLGQSPGATAIALEMVALNFAGRVEDAGEAMPLLDPDGPVAFRSQAPVGRWADALRTERIPARVSYHAGTYLCNATMYLSHLWYHRTGQQVPVGFLHLPVATEQVASQRSNLPSLPCSILTRAVRIVLSDFAAWPVNRSFSYRSDSVS